MIVSKTPLRISLAGGSTDLQGYLDIYGEGRVISFTPNLFTYIILKKSSTKYYKIVYSKIENVISYNDIQNDIAREVLNHFNMPPVEIIFTADIPSSGSGLASSSSYLISLINACLEFKELKWSKEQVGKLAIEIERRFNPLTGYQDIYGCLYTGIKCLHFDSNGLKEVEQLSDKIFDSLDFILLPVGNTRKSTEILSTIDFNKVHDMSHITDAMTLALKEENHDEVCRLVKRGWELKKATSKNISGKEAKKLEEEISHLLQVKALRLIGAGNSGYFLLLKNKKEEVSSYDYIKVSLFN